MTTNKPAKKHKVRTKIVKLASNEIAIEAEKKFFENDNNYIDYFMVVGVDPSIYQSKFLYDIKSPEEISKRLEPEIICKFPNFDKRNVVIENVMINQIFPQGFKAIETDTPPKPIFYCVVLDNQLYSAIYTRKYLACLVIYEEIDSYKKLNNALWGKVEKIHTQSKTSKCRGSMGEFIQKKVDMIYIPKCLCLVSVHPYINKYEEILRNIYNLSKNPKIVVNKKEETNYNINNMLFIDGVIEKLIVETPRVPRGYKKIFLKFPNGKRVDISENKMNELPTVNIDLSRIFQLFSTDNVIDIFKFLLYETKLIFFSKDLPDLTTTILSFLFLLSPFKYQFQIVSVLSKDLYNYIETISPYIFGINETFKDNFFEKNKITVEDATLCIIDIDNDNYFVVAPGGKIDLKEYPEMPKRFKKKLEEKITDLKKEVEDLKSQNMRNTVAVNINSADSASLMSNVKKIENEKYQSIFYKFMIYLLKDYKKYLTKDYSVNKDISQSIKDMIDIKSYLNSYSSSEKVFYQKIVNTQMFMEFIYKRMMPKDANEKVEMLFFEEKVNLKASSNKLFSNKNKALEQSVLLTCPDYDYDNSVLEIDLFPNEKFYYKINNYFLDRKNYAEKKMLSRGYLINIDDFKKITLFSYPIFPSILSDKLFLLNSKDYYKIPESYYKIIDKINVKIVNKSYLKTIQNIQALKNSEQENDLYLCYLIIWSLALGYTEEKERDYLFLNMFEILEKVEEHEMKVFEILFKALVEYCDDEKVIILYIKFINLRMNPSWEMFSMVSKIIKKKHNSVQKEFLLHQSICINDLKEKFSKDKNGDKMIINERAIKIEEDEDDEQIFSNNVLYYGYLRCEECKGIFNLNQAGSDLSLLKAEKDKYGNLSIKCNKKREDNSICNGYCEPKLKFRFGEELFNQKSDFNKYYDVCTSELNEVEIKTPTEIKKELIKIYNKFKNNKQEKFDVEKMRFEYTDIFWSLIFFFDMNHINKNFMLPYKNKKKSLIIEQIEKINTKENKINDVKSIKLKNEGGKNKVIKINAKKKLIQAEKLVIKNIINSDRTRFDTEDLTEQHTHSILIGRYPEPKLLSKKSAPEIYSFKDYFSYEKNLDYNNTIKMAIEKDMVNNQRGSIAYLEQNSLKNKAIVKNQFHCRYGKKAEEVICMISNMNLSSVMLVRKSIHSHELKKKGSLLYHERCINFEDNDSD